MKRLKPWLINFLNWLAEGKLWFLCFTGIFAAMVTVCALGSTNGSLIVVGGSLQLLGIGVTIRGLLKVREEHFHQPKLSKSFWDWWKRFPKWKKSHTGGVHVLAGRSTSTAHPIEIWYFDDPAKTLEQRVECAIENIERLRSQHKAHAEKISNLRRELENHKIEVTMEASKTKEEIRASAEAQNEINFGVSLLGLVWVLVGVAVSTIGSVVAI